MTHTHTLIILLFIISRATTFSENPPSSRIFSVCGHQILCMRRFNAIDYVTRSDFVVIVCAMTVVIKRVFVPCLLSTTMTHNSAEIQNYHATLSSRILCLNETITQICGGQFLPHEYVHVEKRQPHSPWWQSQWYYGFFPVYFHYSPLALFTIVAHKTKD